MPRRSKQHENPEFLRKKLVELIENFAVELEGPDLRRKVLKLVSAFHVLRDLGSSLLPAEQSSARDRILYYFKKYPRRVIKGEELTVVSGINDWPRRVRELRVELGWSIISGDTAREMAQAEEGGEINIGGRSLSTVGRDEYILLDEECDRDAAHRWRMANSIRKLEGVSVQGKLLRFFQANVGRPITGEELRYVTNNKSEWARRVRELRTEEGWPVVTKGGTYILEQDRQAPQHDRKISDEVRIKVLERDHYKCQKCGWDYTQRRVGDPRQLLELHHKVHHAQGGANTVENLITLCNVHHDVIHAKKWTVEELLKDGSVN